jgi:hypothetical protein
MGPLEAEGLMTWEDEATARRKAGKLEVIGRCSIYFDTHRWSHVEDKVGFALLGCKDSNCSGKSASIYSHKKWVAEIDDSSGFTNPNCRWNLVNRHIRGCSLPTS